MASPIPVSKKSFSSKSWQRPTNYLFASKYMTCNLDFSEVAQVALSMPMAFVNTGNGFNLVALLGLKEGQNLYLDSRGQWLSSYIPMEFRFYPFLLASSETGSSVLCFDEDSGLLAEGAAGLPFFEGLEASALVMQIFNELSSRRQRFIRTQELLQKLSIYSLIKPWDLEIQLGGNILKINGLCCIDETAIASLSVTQLTDIRDAGLLPLIYCQLLSMHQITSLAKLFTYRTDLPGSQSDPIPKIDLDSKLSNGDLLSFDNI